MPFESISWEFIIGAIGALAAIIALFLQYKEMQLSNKIDSLESLANMLRGQIEDKERLIAKYKEKNNSDSRVRVRESEIYEIYNGLLNVNLERCRLMDKIDGLLVGEVKNTIKNMKSMFRRRRSQMGDSPKLILFKHPMERYEIEYRNELIAWDHSGKHKHWKRCDQEHTRDLINIKGNFIDKKGTNNTSKELYFWGEWEAAAKINEDGSLVPEIYETGGNVWKDNYRSENESEKRHESDPFVFGGEFYYCSCRQYGSNILRNIPNGSVIVFGNEEDNKFYFDTVFVVEKSILYNNSDIYNQYKDYLELKSSILKRIITSIKNNIISRKDKIEYSIIEKENIKINKSINKLREGFIKTTIIPGNYYNSKKSTRDYRLYFGSTYDNSNLNLKKSFSFFPCKNEVYGLVKEDTKKMAKKWSEGGRFPFLDPTDFGFKRVRDVESRYLEKNDWEKIKETVLKQGYSLGYKTVEPDLKVGSPPKRKGISGKIITIRGALTFIGCNKTTYICPTHAKQRVLIPLDAPSFTNKEVHYELAKVGKALISAEDSRGRKRNIISKVFSAEGDLLYQNPKIFSGNTVNSINEFNGPKEYDKNFYISPSNRSSADDDVLIPYGINILRGDKIDKIFKTLFFELLENKKRYSTVKVGGDHRRVPCKIFFNDGGLLFQEPYGIVGTILSSSFSPPSGYSSPAYISPANRISSDDDVLIPTGVSVSVDDKVFFKLDISKGPIPMPGSTTKYRRVPSAIFTADGTKIY